jgi:CRP-like cAMP-binding protein/membrane protein YdbS with pleckstrin-like domain
VTSKLEFLADVSLFKDLSAGALRLVAGIATEYAFKKGTVVAYQRDAVDSLYIVKEGRLFATTIDPNGRVRDSRPYEKGEYFHDIWLFAPSAHPATVKGSSEEGRILIIRGSDFIRLLEENPGIIPELAPYQDEDGRPTGLSDEAWEQARKLLITKKTRSSSVAALMPEEYIELFTRRSVWFLLIELIVPFMLVLIGAVFLAYFPADTTSQRIIKGGLPAILALLGIIIFVIDLIDWRADYFLITNKHLTHHEFELRRFRIRLVKVPISQVQTVEILKPSLLANVLNIGTAQVTTAAVAGRILFDNIDDPIAVKDTLNRLTLQYRTYAGAQTQAVMRQSIEKHFGADPELTPLDDDTSSPPPPRSTRVDSPWTAFRKRYGWRVVEGNTVTYRKSIYILMRRIGLPTLVYFILFGLAALGIYMGIDGWLIVGVLGTLALVNTVWFIWKIEDWRNDIFQLTDRFVIDIDRLPFGFGESRKQAALSNIQNVDAIRPGFLATLLNYGFVSIDTAGVPADIVFEYVPNPELIQSDIFQRLDDYRQRERIREEGARREEYAMLLDVYRQAVEQDRIPTRTPTGDEETAEG